jgi:hypothetical protein
MKTPDERVQKIIAWRKAIASLPESVFFDLMRMYLGELKTPYTKQKLIEELGAFLQKNEHTETILALLSPFDITVLAAVIHIPLCSADTLFSFFCDEPYMRVYDTVLNLEERLLVFRMNSQTDEKTILAVNPYFEPLLQQRAERDILFAIQENERGSVSEVETRPEPLLYSDDFFAAVFAFVLADGDVCKADGVLKKRAQNRLRGIFFGIEDERLDDAVETLCAGAKNLGLFKMTEKGFVPHFDLWKSFAALSRKERKAYLAAAIKNYGGVLFEVKKNAQLLYRAAESIPQSGCTKTALFRAAFLEQTLESAQKKNAETSRFDSLVHKNNQGIVEGEPLQILIERAVLFGLVVKNDEEPKILYRAEDNPVAEKPASFPLKIDSIFSLTFFPSLSLDTQLSLLQFLELTKFDVVMRCELNKDSAMRGFEAGLTPSTMNALLSKFSGDEISPNIATAINEWYDAYTSVFLYKGYVLRAVPKYAAKIERIPALASRIKATLAAGIYLMDFADDAEAESVFARYGLEHGGKIKTEQKSADKNSFLHIKDKPKITVPETPPHHPQNTETEKITLVLLKKLDELSAQTEMTSGQYESLKDRIKRKIIIDESQLTAHAVRQEKNEAGGMDFLGKLHIIEQALAARSMLELEDRGKKIIGVPTSIEKQPDGAIATFSVEESKTHQRFSVSRLQSVKKLRESIFKNLKL